MPGTGDEHQKIVSVNKIDSSRDKDALQIISDVPGILPESLSYD